MNSYLVRGLGFLALVAVLAWLAWGYWSGPKVPGYRVQPAALVQSVVASGRVAAGSTARVGTEVTGVVSQVLVDEGDAVQAGDVLVRLRDDDQAARVREAEASLEQLQSSRRPQAEARLRQAEVRLAQARREAERRRRLAAANAIPRESLEQAEQVLAVAEADAEQVRLEVASLAQGQTEESILRERLAAARAALQKLALRSVNAGTVVRRNVEPGDLVTAGSTLLEVAEEGATELRVPVDERNLGVIRLGQQAVIIPDAYPEASFLATLRDVAPAVDPQRGTVELRLDPHTLPDYLRSDMTITMTLETGRREQALVVPNNLISTADGQAFVWMLRDGRAVRQDVAIGLRGSVASEILSGIQAGDRLLSGEGLVQGQRVRLGDDALVADAAGPSVRRETPMKFN